MDDRILVPYDGSPLSQRALERAVSSFPDADITVLHVIDPVRAVYEAELKGPTAAESYHDRMERRGESLCEDAAAFASSHDCSIETTVATGRPDREILSYVTDHDIDHVVMGSHGRSGVSRLVLGSVAERVIRRSPVPVTVVR